MDQPAVAGADMAGMDIIYRLSLEPGAARRIVLTMPNGSRFPPYPTPALRNACILAA